MPGKSEHVAVWLSQGQNIWYDSHAGIPGFRCILSSEVMQRLCSNPVQVLVSPRHPKAFWLRVLVESVGRQGQFLFESMLPSSANSVCGGVAVRSLYQLGGDVVVTINEATLARSDLQEVLEAHSRWTCWCLAHVEKALALPSSVYHFAWGCLLCMPLCFVGGFFQYGSLLQPLGILFSIPGHFLLEPMGSRYLAWLPSVLGIMAPGLIWGGLSLANVNQPSVGLWQLFWQMMMVMLFQVSVWPLLGGRVIGWAARKLGRYLMLRRIKECM